MANEQQQAVEALKEGTAKNAQNVELEEGVDTSVDAGPGSIDLLLDITMPVTISLGKTQVPVKRLLQLGPGSVLQLNKSIEEPAEIYVQDVLFATGDVVALNGRFAIRVKEVLGM